MKYTSLVIFAALTLVGTTGQSMGANGKDAAAPVSRAKPTATVHIMGFAFHAKSITVRPGATVLFVNDDNDAHTVTSNDKSFDSGGLDTNDKFTHTFTKVGTYKYFCTLHPYMQGVVVVKGAAMTTGKK